MRNLFVKNYIAFAALILLSFTFAGSVFMAQISRYSVQQKQEQLENTVDCIQTLLQKNSNLLLNDYIGLLNTYLEQQAASSGCTILLTNIKGRVLVAATPQTEKTEDAADAPNDSSSLPDTISDDLLQRIRSDKGYFGLGTISGLFSDNYYICGAECHDQSNRAVALIVAAAPTSSTTDLMHSIMRSYLFIITITLICTLIISWFLSDMLTRPLQSIVRASKKFAHGDFDVRVSENNNCDEIDELAVSFNNMASTLQQQEELSRGFVANVSHELKTPMTSIGGFIDGILDGTIPPDRQNYYLKIIAEEVHRLSRLVLRMLDTAKLEAGEMVITPAPFDLVETGARVLISFEQKLESKQLDVDVQFPDRMMVNGDADRIYQVVYNLVDNAVKFIEPKGKLFMSIETEGSMSLFTVRNSGAGIPAEDLPHVFDRFYKVDRSRSRDKTGAGLGLYIVKSIVILHGGDISVRSANGQTEFAFTLPLAPEPDKHAKTALAPKQ